MAYYLKYRPQKIKELDLVSVRESLGKIVKSGSIPHAFLFSGPKGTGKTSAARILAKIVNCENRKKGSIEPCNKCKQCTAVNKANNIDIVEIDAASHRGIDDIRTLRDAIKLAPADAKQKVYIIDEAHMLTTEASNALLKTLEEPPEHVLFILATTNPEKLIPTIRSRATQIQFKKASISEIVNSLKKKVIGEKISVEDGVLEAVANAADGSFRDADKILEHLTLGRKKVKLADTKEYLSHSGSFDISKMIESLATRNTQEALKLIASAADSGMPVENIVDVLVEKLRNTLLDQVEEAQKGNKGLFTNREIIDLIRILTKAKKDLSFTYLEQVPLEIALIEWCEQSEHVNSSGGSNPEKDDTGMKTAKDNELSKTTTSIDATGKKNHSNGSVNTVNPNVSDTLEKDNLTSGNGAPGKIDDEVWSRILREIRPLNASTEALLRASRPLGIKKNKLTLGVYYKFHKQHLESNIHRTVLEDVCARVLGSKMLVECILTDPPVVKSVNGELHNPSNSLGSTGSVSNPMENVSTNSESSMKSTDGVLAEPNSALTDGDDPDIMRLAEEIFSE